MTKKTIRTLRGAPEHVKKWWSRTGTEAALFKLVENGASWEEAHERLKAAYTRWWDNGKRGSSPLWRLSDRVHRNRILDRIEAGEPFTTLHDGRVAVNYSSYVEPRRVA